MSGVRWHEPPGETSLRRLPIISTCPLPSERPPTVPRPVYELKADLFKTLGHPVRIRVLEVLRDGASSVATIAQAVGVSGSTLSQHLTTLRRSEVVASHREGSTVIYTVTDPRVFELLEVGRAILTSTLEHNREMLTELRQLNPDEPGALEARR